MKPRLTTVIMLGLLFFLFGMIAGALAQEAQDIDLGEVKIAVPQEFLATQDSIQIIQAKIFILDQREYLLELGKVRSKYQARLDSLNNQINRRR